MSQHDHETCFVWCFMAPTGSVLTQKAAPSVELFSAKIWGNQPIDPRLFQVHFDTNTIELCAGWSLEIVDLLISHPWVTVSWARASDPQRTATMGGPLYGTAAVRPGLDLRIPTCMPWRAYAQSRLPPGMSVSEPTVIAATVRFHPT